MEKEKTEMKKVILALGAATGMLMLATSAMAAPTAAGVIISNQATAEYTVDTKPYEVTSQVYEFKVAQIANVAVTNNDVAAVPVAANDTDRVTTFKVTNLGNGPDSFNLSAENVSDNTFPLSFKGIFIDTNNNSTYDPGVDSQFIQGQPHEMTAGSSITVFVLSDIPASAKPEDVAKAELKAQSAVFNKGPVGTPFNEWGPDKVDVILGVVDGAATAQGSYKVTGVKVTLTKSSTFAHPSLGNSPVPGATVTYTIVAQVTGTGTATGLTITDPIPGNTTYVPGSLKLNGVPLSDGQDGDAGFATPGLVTFSLGHVAGGSNNQSVSFQVIIN